MWLTTSKKNQGQIAQSFRPSVAADVFAPPHYRIMKAFKGFINKGTLLAKQLAVLFIEGFSEAPNETVVGFWKAACVLSLSYTRLGAFGWFVKAHEKFLMSGKDLLRNEFQSQLSDPLSDPTGRTPKQKVYFLLIAK